MPDTMPRECAGIDSIASDAPMPHSPPIAIPNSARNTSNASSDGAKAQASPSTEYSVTSIIRMRRRPYRSASRPKINAPSGRNASVSSSANATSAIGPCKPSATAGITITSRKESNASRVQPRKVAATVCRWVLSSARRSAMTDMGDSDAATAVLREHTAASTEHARRRQLQLQDECGGFANASGTRCAGRPHRRRAAADPVHALRLSGLPAVRRSRGARRSLDQPLPAGRYGRRARTGADHRPAGAAARSGVRRRSAPARRRDRRGCVHRLHQMHPGLPRRRDHRRQQVDAYRRRGFLHGLRTLHPALPRRLHRHGSGARRARTAAAPVPAMPALSIRRRRWLWRGAWVAAIVAFCLVWPAWEYPRFDIEPQQRLKAFLQLVLLHGSWLLWPLLLQSGFKAWLRRREQRGWRAGGAIALVLVCAVLCWARFIEPNELVVRRTVIPAPIDLNIALVSDMHVGIYTRTGKLEQMVRKLNSLHVDMVLIAGDLTYDPPDDLATTLAPLRHIN